MKRTIFIATTLLITSAAYSDNIDQVLNDSCKEWGNFAEHVMTLRQADKPLNEIMDRVTKTGNNSILKSIVIEAYDSPAFRTEENQEKSIAQFRNKVELSCFKTANGG
ncbi:hypothetical protein [Brucella lupini]